MRRVVPAAGARDLGTWIGLFTGALLLLQTGTPPQAVALCLIAVTIALLISLRWSLGWAVLPLLVLLGVYLRVDLGGHVGSDVLAVTRAAIDAFLAGGNPYGRGYDISVPPGAPFAYGPLALLWFIPAHTHPADMELLV